MQNSELTTVERFLAIFTRIRPGEGRAILLYALYGMVLMTSYYALKVMREALILSGFSAEIKSYAQATIAILLFFIIPLYGLLYRMTQPVQLVRWITVFFAVNIVIFYMMYNAGMEIGFIFFVWVSIFSVMIFAQFWAFAADSFNVKTGQRLFPVIMAGQSIGALAGAQLSRLLEPVVGVANMLLVAAGMLAVTAFLTQAARRHVPAESAAPVEPAPGPVDARSGNLLGGLALVMKSRYLVWVAILAILLNWVNSTGEYILGALVKQFAEAQVAGGDAVNTKSVIAAFYGDFFFWVNLISVSVQVFLVSRIFRWIGVGGALLVLPLIAIIGYGMIVFVPIFGLIRLVKIMENATDYSLMNTTRHALYLPLSEAEKYEGKTAIDTFFWRFGDLIQAGAIFLGLNYLNWDFTSFAAMNMTLSVIWLVLAIAIGKHYRHLLATNVGNRPPELARAIPDVYAPPGSTLMHVLDSDHFVDADPGDVLAISAKLANDDQLPSWLTFNEQRRKFTGVVPYWVEKSTVLRVTATDFEGLAVSTEFTVHHQTQAEVRAHSDPGQDAPGQGRERD